MTSAPFPWFGGKSRVADQVWERFGDVPNYVEPFFGSGAVLLGRPDGPGKIETVNDLDGFLANFWRAIQHDPETTAAWADAPVNECDLHARHAWLVSQRGTLTERLMGSPDFYDPKIAGWWVWGINSWIGSGWCAGTGPWIVQDGSLIDSRQLPHLGDAGQGINRQLPHLGNAGQGINRQLPHLGNAGRGINRKLPHLGDAGRGYAIRSWFGALAERLRDVRVCCGDWRRIVTDSVTTKHGMTAVFLDPPYADTADRTDNLYAMDSNDVAHEVRKWCIENGTNPSLRIALCGYEGEHDTLPGWSVLEWSARGGYNKSNRHRERIWFSPACIAEDPGLVGLFDDGGAA